MIKNTNERKRRRPDRNPPKGKAIGYYRNQRGMDKKDAFITEVITMTNGLAKYYTDRSNEIQKSYFDNEYNTSVTQEDLDRLFPGVTVADFTAGITMMGQINNFTGGQAVTTADYQATINKLRITGIV